MTRRGRLLAVAAAVLTTAVAQPLPVWPVEPSDGELATLWIGPVRRRGIDALAPDLTPHWYARYSVAGLEVEVFMFDAPFDRAQTWPVSSLCAERPLRARDGLWYYASRRGWSMIVSAADDALVCRFVDGFVTRYEFFVGVDGRLGSVPPFPAILNDPSR